MNYTIKQFEQVAKFANIPIVKWNDGLEPYSSGEGYILTDNSFWNPVTINGDSFRLAIILGIRLDFDVTIETESGYKLGVEAYKVLPEDATITYKQVYGDDPEYAARLAVFNLALALSSPPTNIKE